MVDYELRPDAGLLLVRPEGPLEKVDFEKLTTEVDAHIAAHKRLNGLVIIARTFPGWENLEGAIAHFRFIEDHHKKIARIAFVSDSPLLTLLPKLAEHFVCAEIKEFKAGEEAAALAWAGG